MLRSSRGAALVALAFLMATGACSASHSGRPRGLRGLGVGVGLATDRSTPASGLAGLSSSPLVFVSDRSSSYQIYSMHADGKQQHALTRGSARDSWPALSPDGTRIAFARTRDGNTDIYGMNADGTGVRRLTTSPAPDYHPTWSQDGTRIAFESMRDGNADIYVMNADGSDQVNLTRNAALDGSPAWS